MHSESRTSSLSQALKEAGLKVTPQRMSVLEAVHVLGNHPTADGILEYIRKAHPGIATGTVYKVLNALVESGLITRVKADRDVMRYDGVVENHHHLYCSESDRIDDYSDPELDRILEAYFSKKNIPGFRIEEIKLQINGKFLKNQ
jgi:Fur family peroxide stress response transcriptional regulator